MAALQDSRYKKGGWCFYELLNRLIEFSKLHILGGGEYFHFKFAYKFKIALNQTKATLQLFAERQGTMFFLLHYSPKFSNHVFLLVGLTTVWTSVNFDWSLY